MFPAVRGMHEMIGAGNSLEVEAGYRMLEQGGNAVDAGVAAILAATVTEQDHIGLGGEMPLLIKMTGKPVVVISGVGVAPSKATVEFFKHRSPEPWEQRHGFPPDPQRRHSLRHHAGPGRRHSCWRSKNTARCRSPKWPRPPSSDADAFPAPEVFTSNTCARTAQVIGFWPTSQKFYFPNGTVPKPGDVVHMADLARTLREMATAEKKAHGDRDAKLHAVHDYFYKGAIAKRIVAFSEANGGTVRLRRSGQFPCRDRRARTTTYRGYTIYKPGFWTQGPVMIEALNILEGFDLKAMGHNSPEYLHTVIEAVKLAFADRDRYYGDPKFSKIPEETLLSKYYAAERRKLIDPEHASMESRPGDLGASAPATGGGGPRRCE